MKRPELMAILNLTPDSFSGDGVAQIDEAVERFAQLANMGADIIDIGAESTRPGAIPLSAGDEWERLGPVLGEILPQEPLARLSVDTYHSITAERALAVGANIINDISGLTSPGMGPVLRDSECDIVVMHSLSIPADKTIVLPPHTDPIRAIQHWKLEVTRRAEEKDIDPARLIFDPGIGFGKTARQSLALVTRAAELTNTGGRWLFGHSRKSFLKLFGDEIEARKDTLTVTLSALLAESAVDILRVHDIVAHKRMLDALCK